MSTRSGITAVLASTPRAQLRAGRAGPGTVVVTGPGIRLILTTEQAEALGLALISPARRVPK